MSKLAWGVLSTANIGIKRVIPAIMSGQCGTVAALASRDAGHAAKVAADFGIERS
jgi:predicted dehydrogenase